MFRKSLNTISGRAMKKTMHRTIAREVLAGFESTQGQLIEDIINASRYVSIKPVFLEVTAPVLIHHQLPGIVHVVVKRLFVHLRQSDCWLCATQLLVLSGRNKNERDSRMKQLKQRTNVEVIKRSDNARSWVCFPEGQKLCEDLGTSKILAPLLGHGRRRLRTNCEKPPKYRPISTGTGPVWFRQMDFWLNTSQIMEVGSLRKRTGREDKVVARLITVSGGIMEAST